MPRRKDHTREELKSMALEAGVAILNTEGIAALTAREIARKIGYTVGTLYNVFENFNDLIFHLNAQTMDAMYAAFTDVVKQKKINDKESVLELARTYIEFAHANAPAWRLLFEARITDNALPEWYNQKIERLFKLVENALLPLVNNSIPRAAIAAKVLWASLYGICILSITGKVETILGETAQSLAKSFVNDYLKGLSITK